MAEREVEFVGLIGQGQEADGEGQQQVVEEGELVERPPAPADFPVAVFGDQF